MLVTSSNISVTAAVTEQEHIYSCAPGNSLVTSSQPQRTAPYANELNGEWCIIPIKSVLQDYAWGSHFDVTLHPCNAQVQSCTNVASLTGLPH